MKNQLDLIIGIVALVLAFIIAFVFMIQKREVVKPAPPTQVNLTQLTMPEGSVKFGNGLGSSRGGVGGGAPTAGIPGGKGGRNSAD